MFKPPVRKESSIERSILKWCQSKGIDFAKMQAKKGWPDRFVILPNKQILWIELKRPGEKPTPLQLEVHDHLRRQGHEVEVHDSRQSAIDSIWCHLQPARVSEASD